MLSTIISGNNDRIEIIFVHSKIVLRVNGAFFYTVVRYKPYSFASLALIV